MPPARWRPEATRERTIEAFDAWDMGGTLGTCTRMLGHTDAVAWRVVELARAMLAIPTGDIERAADDDAVLARWLEDPGVRAATGWNEWQGHRYIRREAWDELLDTVVARIGSSPMAPTRSSGPLRGAWRAAWRQPVRGTGRAGGVCAEEPAPEATTVTGSPLSRIEPPTQPG